MRMPNKDEDLIGKVCVCSVGRPFIVTGRTEIKINQHIGDRSGVMEFDTISGWCGLGLDGKGTAFSTNPCVLAESGQEFHDTLLKRFHGKMSFNG